MSDNEKPTTDHHGHVDTQPRPAEEQLGDEPPHHGMSAGQYLASRFTSLKPPMSKLPNPLKLILMLNGHHWAFFLVAFFAWTWDAFDFFTVSLTVSDLAETFGQVAFRDSSQFLASTLCPCLHLITSWLPDSSKMH